MRLANHECKHCLDDYTHQWSGNYDAVETPKEYRDQEYCPECKKAIVNALAAVPKQFEYKYVKTDEVDLNTLLRWEKEFWDDIRSQGLLRGRRIFSKLYHWERKEHQSIEQVIGREDKSGRKYIYCYWPSNPKEYTITVEKRINLITGEEVGYKLDK